MKNAKRIIKQIKIQNYTQIKRINLKIHKIKKTRKE